MDRHWPRSALSLGATLVVVAGVARLLFAQDAAPEKSSPATGRFEFDIVESFDAQYEGDTPGHIGRNGGLGDAAPMVALGDSVFRGDVKVGTVSRVVWSRVQGSLEVEFDPEPKTRITVGDEVWLNLGGGAK